MKHGGKRAGAGRKKVGQAEPATGKQPSLSIVHGGPAQAGPDSPDEPDWTQLFVDELDISLARQQWRILITELRAAEKLATANYSHIKRTVFHQVMWERAARQVAEVGAVIPKKGRRGPKPNPWWAALKDANAMVATAEAELTITPRRRNNGGKVQRQKPTLVGGGYLKPVAR
jgi:phage terminase small subunit